MLTEIRSTATDSHEYESYFAVEDIDHTRTKVKSLQTNGICERFRRRCSMNFIEWRFVKDLQHPR